MYTTKINLIKFLDITFFCYFCAAYKNKKVENRKKSLSILLPTYNYNCVNLVCGLQEQAAAEGIEYEIIVGDDGSTREEIISQNKQIDALPHCRYIVRGENKGRAAIRNFLAQISRYEWLLFLDCDMQLPDRNFICRYLEHIGKGVIDGGIRIGGDKRILKNNIRYLYEHEAEPRHTAKERGKAPYKSFRTTNFMAERSVVCECPFDERIRHYGYEDVLFGKVLKKKGIPIKHIDNPMVLTDYEANEAFIEKAEEALRTLYEFKEQLRGYSNMLTKIGILQRIVPLWLIRWWHVLFGKLERKNLTGRHPSLRLFNLYRIGYYISLIK